MDSIVAIRSFIRVVETGSFSAVAKEQNTNQATISKRVAGLEKKLGTKLLVRGSRRHTLTEAGQAYFERVSHIVAAIDEAEAEARSLTATPKGHLKITVPTMFGSLYVAPIISEFLAAYPDIDLDIKFDENLVALVKEGIDVAIRLGDLQDSSMMAKTLGYDELIMVASPTYLERHPAPTRLEELNAHNCLIYSLSPKRGTVWTFNRTPGASEIPVSGNFQCDNGIGLKEMLLAHAGIALMPRWMVDKELRTGDLVHLLPDYAKRYPISAVFTNNQYVPLKVRVFLAFMETTIAADPVLSKV
ncbi:LysR family transcriptional regulator [Vibrio coralliilyticus]|uniref:LysR family transcriptional regulator n=1 Tax=Vibrio coralliilyticus TaxID=190893 RepID=A0AAN0SKH8_9VIBR|nr:LysR family transcriptional regulator [Vibrio coralliilyticus]AIW22856.1 LysR family transcriptional regulator [Vibrio coralliilyticus]NOH38389.1 LysR family transcriptional regulator [Vibrio coralliilyticus]NOH55187.1 LysR family transcriptional regulator [Vibrio coralliilyticus]